MTNLRSYPRFVEKIPLPPFVLAPVVLSKPAKQGRTLSFTVADNGLIALTITDERVAKSYWVREIPADFGRGFEFTRFASEVEACGVPEDEREYHVHLDVTEDGKRNDSCTCRHGTFRPNAKPCRHGAAVLKLRSLGKL